MAIRAARARMLPRGHVGDAFLQHVAKNEHAFYAVQFSISIYGFPKTVITAGCGSLGLCIQLVSD